MRTALIFALAFFACVEADPDVHDKNKDAATNDATLDAGELAEAGEIAEAGTEDAGEAGDAAAADAAAADAADAAAADAGQPNCTFNTTPPTTPNLDPRIRLSATRLDDLIACGAATYIDAFLEEHRLHGNSAPLEDNTNNTALVLYRGDASNLSVSGSFDGWPSPGARTFRNVPATDLHVAELPIGANDRHQYKLTRNLQNRVEWTTDPLNRWVVWDGFDVGGPGQFNNEVFGASHNFTTSTIYRFYIRDRDVFLQLPVAHYMLPVTMGVLYVHDGNEMLTRAGMQTVVDQTIVSNRAAPVALAYIALPSQEVRFDEYTYDTATANGDNYVAMIADEIAPEVEQYVHVGAMPELRGLAGASLGGLISFYGAWIRNDAFRLIGGQSSSLFWNDDDMIDRFASPTMIEARIYLDSGSPDDNSEVTRAMSEVLQQRGYDFLHVEESGAAHEWPFWAGRFDELLEFLY